MSLSGAPIRVLLVEDEALVAIMMEDQLAELGFQVVGPAATVSQAIALCESERIDGALLDVNLGAGQRSDQIAELLTERNIPFVFVTGYGETGLDKRFSSAPVLQKPFTMPELRKLVAGRFNGNASS